MADPKNKRFYIEVELYATPKRKEPRVSVGFVPRLKDGSYDQTGKHGLRYCDEVMWDRVQTALREFCKHLIYGGEL